MGLGCWRNGENYFILQYLILCSQDPCVSIVFAPLVVFMVPRAMIMKERKYTTGGTYLF